MEYFLLLSTCLLTLITGGEFNECPKGECPAKSVNHEKEKWRRPDSGLNLEDFNLDSLGGILGSLSSGNQGGILTEMLGNLAGDSNPLELLKVFSQLGAGGEGLDIGSLMQMVSAFSQPKSRGKAASGDMDLSLMTNLLMGFLSNGKGAGGNPLLSTLSSVVGSNWDSVVKNLPEGGLDDLTNIAMDLMETGDVQKSLPKLMKSSLFRSVTASLADFMDSSNAVDSEGHSDTARKAKMLTPNLFDGFKKLFDSVFQNNKDYLVYYYGIMQKIYGNIVSMSGDISSLDEEQIVKIQMQIVSRCQAMTGKVDEVMSDTGSDPILRSSIIIIAGLLYDKKNPELAINDIRGLLKGIKDSPFIDGLLKQIPKLSSILENFQKLQKGDFLKTIGALVSNSMNAQKPRSSKKESSAAPGKNQQTQSDNKKPYKDLPNSYDLFAIFNLLEHLTGVDFSGPDVIATVYKQLTGMIGSSSGLPHVLGHLVDFLELDGVIDVAGLLTTLSSRGQTKNILDKIMANDVDLLEILDIMGSESFLNEIIDTSEKFISAQAGELPIDKMLSKLQKLEQNLPEDFMAMLKNVAHSSTVVRGFNATQLTNSMRRSIEDKNFRSSMKGLIGENFLEPVTNVWKAYLEARKAPNCREYLLCSVNRKAAQEKPYNSLKALVTQCMR